MKMRLLNILLHVLWVVAFIFHPTDAGFLGLLKKLPSSAVPLKYDITLEPNIAEATFKGNVTIELKILEQTNNITFHASRLEISKDDVTMKHSNGEIIPVSGIEIDRFIDFYTIVFENNLQGNEIYQLTITYSGELRNDNQGFYLAKYQDENGTERFIATTFFTKINARSAFPCFDEPALKAQFAVKLIRPENYSSVSNEEKIRTEDLGNGRCLDVFRETSNMSTYLVAFVISEFKHTDVNGLHRIFARPQAINEGKAEYALKESKPALEAVEDYIGMKYTFPKVDHIAIPDDYFTGEALENWGLISYNEKTLLISKDTSTSMDEQTTLTSMLHEFTHQWFGNLVTPSDWKYLWLSEGFATYLQFRIGDTIRPAWRLLDQIPSIILQNAFEGESSFSKTSLSDFFAPRWVSYLKASAIIRMMEHFVTPDVFREGLQQYLKDNQFNAVEPSDLYAALQTTVDEKGVAYLLGHHTITDIMTTWDSVASYPLVNVARDYENGQITFKQSTFKPFEFLTVDENQTWYVPINYVFNAKSQEDFAKTTADCWLTEKVYTPNSTFTTDGWMIVNKQFTGYYRVNYDLTNWNRLISFLNSPYFHKIHVLNRAQLIDDSFDLAKYGKLDYEIPLGLSTYLSQERNYVPFASFFNAIELLNKRLSSSGIYPDFKNYIINILNGVHEYLGYEEVSTDDHLDKLNRAHVLKWLCMLGHSECYKTALNKVRNWKSNETAFIPPNLQEALLCGAMRVGTQEDWNFLFEKYKIADSSEGARILNALSCSENENIITNFLEKIRDINSTILTNSHRKTALTAIIKSGNVGLKVANNYIKQHFRDFWNLVEMETVLSTIGSGLTTDQELDELKAFKSRYVGVHMAFRPGMAFARINIDWKNKYLPQITEWFNSRKTSTASV